MNALEKARQAVSFLTPLPSGNAKPSAETMAYFPLAGAAIGLVEGLAWSAARRAMSPVVAGAVTTAADLALTGALHLDGLADTADGLLAHQPAKSRLEIMAEPQLGTFGTAAVVSSVLMRTAALSESGPSPLFMAAVCCSSRSAMVLCSRRLPYARRDGLAEAFLPTSEEPDRSLRAAAAGLAAGALLAGLSRGRRGLLALAAGGVAAGGVAVLSKRRLGGFTGDVLGAVGVTLETVALTIGASQ